MYKYTALENIFVSLSVLSKLNVNEKVFINTNNKIAAALDTKYNAILRFISGDNRIKTLNYINTIINDSIDKIYQYEKSGDHFEMTLKSQILNSLKKSCIGLENLKLTYENDTYVVSYLESIIERINMHHDLFTKTKHIDIVPNRESDNVNYPVIMSYSV